MIKGKRRWYYNVEAANGEIVQTSQKYFSHWNAKRAARKEAKLRGYEVVERI